MIDPQSIVHGRVQLTPIPFPIMDADRGWRGFVLDHIARVEASAAPSLISREAWQRMACDDVLDFIVREDKPRPVGGRIGFSTQAFGPLFVAASFVPVTSPRKIRQLLPSDGYMPLLDELLLPSGLALGQADLAHWLLCLDRRKMAVHLCYLPTRYESTPLSVDI